MKKLFLFFIFICLSFVACSDDNAPDINKHIPTVEINGILWDTENIVINGTEHFTFEEAQAVAKRLGKRLPTPEEFESLAALGSIWDSELKGYWVGEDHALKGESVRSIFLPAAGTRYAEDGRVHEVGTIGYYWSSIPAGDGYGYFMSFIKSVHPIRTYGRAAYGLGCSMRCVKDKLPK